MISKKKRKPSLRLRSQFSDTTQHAASLIYWTVMLFLILLNFLAALVLIPFFLFTPTIPLYVIVVLLGLFFGYIFHLLIRQLEYIEREHRIFAAIFVPFLATINILIVTGSVQVIASILELPESPEPATAAVIYLVAFVTPSLISFIPWVYGRKLSF